MAHKPLVLWACKNEPVIETPEEGTESDDGEELDIEFTEEEEDTPPKAKKGKKKVVVEDSEDEDEDSDEDEEDEDEKPKKKGKDNLPEGWEQKKLDNLRKKAKEAKSNGEWVNAETNRKVAKTDKNKKKFVFTKHGFCVDIANEQLQEQLEELF